jgi:hypothetical protein
MITSIVRVTDIARQRYSAVLLTSFQSANNERRSVERLLGALDAETESAIELQARMIQISGL